MLHHVADPAARLGAIRGALAPARRWLAQGLERSVGVAHARLSADDLATLAVLTDPADPRGVMRRRDVDVHAGRTPFAARRPRQLSGGR